MKRWVPLVSALVAVAVGAPGGGFAARATTGSAVAPLLGPSVAGAQAYVAGTYVWTDYAYDDTGVTYPSGLSNAADLVQLQLRKTPSGLRVTALLETLRNADVPVLGLGFDTDRNTATGAASLPGGGWSANGALGLEQLVVLDGSGGRLLTFDGSSWQPSGQFPATVDPATNTIDATIPTALLDPGTATWNAVAALGAADGGHSWLDGGQPISDLAFVGGEAPSGWQNTVQAGVLSGAVPVSNAIASIDFAAMATGATSGATDDMAPGFHTRLYRSALDLGEGIGQAHLTLPGGGSGPVGNLYAGPYQPYLVWVGEHLSTPPPVVVYMHGFTQTHTSNSGSFGPVQGGVSPAGLLLGNGGFTPNAIVVFPLGRGEDTFYFGAAEQDVLDATDDALAHFAADPDRVVLSGVSMGGFGTFRIGTLYPDRWSALVPFIGTGGSPQYEFSAVPPAVRNQVFSPTGFPTGHAELLENINNVPMRMINGQIDPIVDNVLVTQDALRLDQLGYDYRSWVLLRRHHEVVPSLSNCVFTDALTRVRDTDPAHVVLSVEPELNMADPSTGLDLHYDHAYWVSHVVVAAGVEKGTVDATSLARTDRSRVASHVLGAGQNLTTGADLCGVNPDVQTGDAWRLNGIALAPGTSAAVSNAAKVVLTAVTDATLDVGAMQLSTSSPLTVTITADADARLVLHGPWNSAAALTIDGASAGSLSPSDDAISLPVRSGQHTYVLGS